LGRLEKTLLQLSTNITNWEDRLQYELFCKTYFPNMEPRRDIFRGYNELVQIRPLSKRIDTQWLSLHFMHLASGNLIHASRQFIFS